MSKLTKALTAAAGNAGESLYVEDVFSTYLYTGNGSTQTITNGVDLDGEGGLVWIKQRDGTRTNHVFNTEVGLTGTGSRLRTDSTAVAANTSSFLTSFNANGFTVGDDSSVNVAYTSTYGGNYASWTFRKAEKFFDVVTWTGDGTAGRQIAHNLGSAPAFVMVKRTNTTNNWICWHSALTNTQYIQINQTTQALSDGGIFWNSTTPDASNLTLGSDSGVNGSGSTYVAYLFASDAGGFGDDGSESIIKCGSYTGDGGAGTTEVNLGFEPQWILVKATSAADNWFIIDNMRGWATESNTSNDAYLLPNASNAEATGGFLDITATGFKTTLFSNVNVSGRTYAYVAIRRPMKTPESGTEVFAVGTNQEVPSATSGFYSGFPVDMAIKRIITASQPNYLFDRLRGGQSLVTNTTAAESGFGAAEFDHQQGWYYDSDAADTNDYSWMFKRATGFFDVVAYTGNGTAGRTIAHNLGVVPELMIVKSRSGAYSWQIYTANRGATEVMTFTTDPSSASVYPWNSTAPTSSVFTVGGTNGTNSTLSGVTYIAYLFASVAGVSKVGSYTGTGSNVDVDCGFSAGARFILIKRTDSTSQWYLWDSKRGIVAGNDPWIELNTTNAQNSGQDAIDPLASGFTVTAAADVNQSGGNYIFLAIA